MTNRKRPGAANSRHPEPRLATRTDGVERAGTRHVLIYDDSCAMCRTWAERVRHWDRYHRIELVPSHGAEVGSRFPWIVRERLDAAMQLVEPNGTTHEGAGAAEALLRVLPLGRLLAWTFWVPGARAIAARVYRAIAARRCREACAVHGPGRGTRA